MDVNTGALLLIAVFNMLTAFMAWRTHNTLGKVDNTLGKVRVDVIETKQNIAVVEQATNSMKDALVAKTAEASHAEGELKGRRDVRAELSK